MTAEYVPHQRSMRTGRPQLIRKFHSLNVSTIKRAPADAKFTNIVAITNPGAPNPEQRTSSQSNTPFTAIAAR